MKKSEYEKLIHEAQFEIDAKAQPKMESFLKELLSKVADKDGNIPMNEAIRATYYAASKLAIGVSAGVTAKIIEKLGIVTLEDA